jgi:hypothetical protein
MECATDAELVRWFASRVRRYYPWALMVQFPGAHGETSFAAPPSTPEGRIRAARSPWQGIAIIDRIRK